MDVETVPHAQEVASPGRGDRVARTRQAIVASALALALAGEVAPIVRDIAKMAGVSARTVFQHFADTAELYVAVLGRVMAGVIGDVPDLTSLWALDERIVAIIATISARDEQLLPMWTFVEALQRRSTEASEMMVQFYSANRSQLAGWFDRELSVLPSASREQTLNALAMALAPESWVMLRQRLGLSVEDARDELHFITRAIFNGSAQR